MKILDLPRNVAAWEYKALRYPAQLLETKVLATRLPADSPVRLAVERLLGSLDSTAGALLANPTLQERGRRLTRRTEVLAKAVALEEKAAERKQQATVDLRDQTRRATEAKQTAEQDQRQAAGDIAAKRQATLKAVEQAAQSRQQAERAQAQAETSAALAQEQDRLRAQKSAIRSDVMERTAGAKEQLKQASQESKTASKRTEDADRLAELADAERTARKS